jgi:ERCC4-type nuclease
MLITVDSNEKATNPKIVEEMKRMFPKLKIASLESGDINIILDTGDLIAIERKNASDFLGSIGDQRLFKQVEKMAKFAKFYCIIVIGSFAFTQDDMVVCNGEITNWKGASLRGAMYSIQWSACPVIFTKKERFNETIMEVISLCSKPDKHMQRNHKRVLTFPPVDDRVDIISAFPGIGLTRAEALLNFVSESESDYGSIGKAIAWASCFPLMDEKARPEGWGNKTVQTFRGMLGLKPNEYLDIKEEKKKK